VAISTPREFRLEFWGRSGDGNPAETSQVKRRQRGLWRYWGWGWLYRCFWNAGKGRRRANCCITHSTIDLAQGFLAQTAPLAQVLLGGVVGDEVVLRVPR